MAVLWGSSVCSFLHSTGGPEAETQAGGSIGSSVQRQSCVCMDISVHTIPVLRRILRLKNTEWLAHVHYYPCSRYQALIFRSLSDLSRVRRCEYFVRKIWDWGWGYVLYKWCMVASLWQSRFYVSLVLLVDLWHRHDGPVVVALNKICTVCITNYMRDWRLCVT